MFTSLDAHQRRRRDGQPVVSVLCGSTIDADTLWKNWCVRAMPERGELRLNWTDVSFARIASEILQLTDLRNSALCCVSGLTDCSMETLVRRDVPGENRDAELFWDNLELQASDVSLFASCRRVLESSESLQRTTSVAAHDAIWIEQLNDWLSIIPVATMPSVFMTVAQHEPQQNRDNRNAAQDMRDSCEALVQFAEQLPAVPCALTIDRKTWLTLTKHGGNSRRFAILRDGRTNSANGGIRIPRILVHPSPGNPANPHTPPPRHWKTSSS